MMEKAFSCPLCQEDYNQIDRLPRILNICGHTFCSMCADDLVKGKDYVQCPLDSKTSAISQDSQVFLPNFSLSQVITKRTNEKICKIHDKKMKILCLTDRCAICSYCERYGDHKGHNTKLIQDVENEAKRALKNLEASLDKVEKRLEEVVNSQKAQKELFMKTIKDKFEEVREALVKEEAVVLSEANHFFDIEEEGIKELLGNESIFTKVINKKIEETKNTLKGTDWFYGFEESSRAAYELAHELVDRHIAELHKSLANISQDFTMSLESRKPANRLVIPVEDFRTKLNNLKERVQGTLSTGESFEGSSFTSLLDIDRADENSLIITAKANLPEIMVNEASDLTSDEFKKITSITLDLSKGKMMEEMVVQLINLWKNMDHLSSLKLNFLPEEDIGEALTTLPFLMTHFTKSLQTLELCLHAHDIDDEKLRPLLLQLAPKISNLKRLVLDFSHTNITGSCLESLGESGIMAWNNMEDLDICLAHTKADNQGICHILSTKMLSLQSLKLDLIETDITDKTIETLTGKTLPSISSLKHVEVRIHGQNITEFILSQLLNTNIPSIKTLVLDLKQTNISDPSMKMFAETLKTNTLENLDLNLANTALTDTGIVPCLTNLGSNLKSFRLNLEHCDKVTDMSLLALGLEALPRLRVLEYLDLNFSNTGILDKGLTCVLKSHLTNIKFLGLQLNSTKISNLSIDEFKKALQGMKALKNLKLDLNRTKITKESQSFVDKVISELN